MPSRAVAGALLVWLALQPAALRGEPVAPSDDDFTRALHADALELAALVARAGDDAVLRRLAAGAGEAGCLVAARSAPTMRDPEQALGPLAALATGRDPEIAEAAARSARLIAQGVASEPSAREELAPGDLRGARDAFAALGASTTARADLKQLGLETAVLLAGLEAR